MPQLDPTWFASQLFWLAVAFVMLYVILSRFILPPLTGIMLARRQTVENDISKAQTLKTEAEQARLDYEKTLAESREKARQLVAAAMHDEKVRAEQTSKDFDRMTDKKALHPRQ